MQRIFFPVLFFLIINTSEILSQHPAIVNKEAADILLSLSNNQQVDNELTILHSALNSFEQNDLEKEYLTTAESFDSLKNNLTDFECELKNITTDSGLVLFNQWYLHFNNVFYKYNKRIFFASNNKKIIFFSTSMSCYCTLEMCKKQLIDILKLLSQKSGGCPCSGRQINTEKYDLLVVDTYENNELQFKYETFFSPSVIILDGSNKMLYKIEYDDRMLEQLTVFINSNLKIEGFN